MGKGHLLLSKLCFVRREDLAFEEDLHSHPHLFQASELPWEILEIQVEIREVAKSTIFVSRRDSVDQLIAPLLAACVTGSVRWSQSMCKRAYMCTFKSSIYMCIGVHVCVHFLAGFARTSCKLKSYIHAGNHSYINRLRSIHALRDSVRGLMCVFLPHDDYY